MDVEVNRTGSADSENGSSDGGYVQITKEDAQGGDLITGVEAEVNQEEDVPPSNGDKVL